MKRSIVFILTAIASLSLFTGCILKGKGEQEEAKAALYGRLAAYAATHYAKITPKNAKEVSKVLSVVTDSDFEGTTFSEALMSVSNKEFNKLLDKGVLTPEDVILLQTSVLVIGDSLDAYMDKNFSAITADSSKYRVALAFIRGVNEYFKAYWETYGSDYETEEGGSSCDVAGGGENDPNIGDIAGFTAVPGDNGVGVYGRPTCSRSLSYVRNNEVDIINYDKYRGTAISALKDRGHSGTIELPVEITADGFTMKVK